MIHHFLPGGKDAPVLLLLHGTGGNENDLLELGRSMYPNASLLSPRGNILENGMPRFFRRLAEGIFDEADLIFRTNELADFVAATLQENGFNDRPIVAVGYSNGANIAASLILLRPEVLAGAILLRAMVPLVPKMLPDITDTQVFLAGGERDPIIPPENTERLASMLKEAGASVHLHWTAAGHELHSTEIAAAKDWLAATFPTES